MFKIINRVFNYAGVIKIINYDAIYTVSVEYLQLGTTIFEQQFSIDLNCNTEVKNRMNRDFVKSILKYFYWT